MTTEIKILRLPEVMAMTGMSRSMVYKLCKHGDFPKQIKLHDRASGWVSEEVEAWLRDKISASRG